MQVLMPLAGAGSRFIDAGYKKPKPLINVDDVPMIIRATSDLPKGEKYLFLCRVEHLEEYPLKRTLEKYHPESTIIPVQNLTQGQACTCLLAEEFLDLDDSLLIGACDNGLVWQKEQYNQLISNENIDAIIWTFTNHITTKRNPEAYGWVKHIDDRALRVSVKVPISENVLNDQAIVGTFYFRRAQDFITYTKQMIQKDIRVNNEFYVDSLMNELIEANLDVRIFNVEKYICWGSPNDLRTYQYWQDAFDRVDWHPYKKENP